MPGSQNLTAPLMLGASERCRSFLRMTGLHPKRLEVKPAGRGRTAGHRQRLRGRDEDGSGISKRVGQKQSDPHTLPS